MIAQLKLYLIAGAFVLALAVGAFVSWSLMHASAVADADTIKTLTARNTALELAAKADASAASVREKGRATNGANYETSRTALDVALAATPWGSVPVPDDVARVLVAPLGASNAQ